MIKYTQAEKDEIKRMKEESKKVIQETLTLFISVLCMENMEEITAGDLKNSVNKSLKELADTIDDILPKAMEKSRADMLSKVMDLNNGK